MDQLNTDFTSLKQIDTNTREGQLLIAAIGQIKNRCCPEKSHAEILTELNLKAKHIFENDNDGGNTQ